MLGVWLLMSDLLFKIFGGAILSVMLITVLKKENPDGALMLRLAAAVCLGIAAICAMRPVIEYARSIGELHGMGDGISSAVSVLLKALGISLLTHASSTVCRDCGEGSIAYYVELAGKIEMLILSLPLIKGILDMAIELLEMGQGRG